MIIDGKDHFVQSSQVRVSQTNYFDWGHSEKPARILIFKRLHCDLNYVTFVSPLTAVWNTQRAGVALPPRECRACYVCRSERRCVSQLPQVKTARVSSDRCMGGTSVWTNVFTSDLCRKSILLDVCNRYLSKRQHAWCKYIILVRNDRSWMLTLLHMYSGTAAASMILSRSRRVKLGRRVASRCKERGGNRPEVV